MKMGDTIIALATPPGEGGIAILNERGKQRRLQRNYL